MKDTMKKLSISILIIILLLSFNVTILPAQQVAAASHKYSLSRKTVTMTVRKQQIIRVKKPSKRVKWSTTNKKIAYIKKTSGKRRQTACIKAGSKVGKCWIKARIGKKTLRCRVTVKRAKKNSVEPFLSEEERVIKTRPLSGSARDLAADMTAAIPENSDLNETFNTNTANFSVDLLKQTIASDPNAANTNTLISPDSVLTAMAMTENGAGTRTLAQMEQVFSPGMTAEQFNQALSVLNNSLTSAGKPIYSAANSIWALDDESELAVDPAFVQKNKNYHNASFFLAPFTDETLTDINNWVYNNTRNMIDGIIDRFPDDIRMLLINAVSFEGKWVEPMNKLGKLAFTKADGTVQQVDMLQDRGQYQYLELNGGKGFAKYYQTDNSELSKIAFVGLLPPEGMSADTYLNSFSGEEFITAWNASSKKLVDIRIPKFRYDYSASMKDALQQMGITIAFSDDADFSYMIEPAHRDTQQLKIDDVLHKTHIELNEYGTKAAAATAVTMVKAGCAPSQEPPVCIHLNRPFVYALIDTETGIPLFVGVVRTVPEN